MEAGADEVRAMIERIGASALDAGPLDADDAENIWWAGSPAHVASIVDHLRPGKSEDRTYLCVRTPDGFPVGLAAIDCGPDADFGFISQAAVHPELENLGVGGRLFDACEKHIAALGFSQAALSVDVDNTRAAGIYRRRRYVEVGTRVDSWSITGSDGSTSSGSADVIDMVKILL